MLVLLVSDDPRWTAPVREAATALGGVVETMPARAAVMRLAGAKRPPSHVLLDLDGTAGLLAALSGLASDAAGSGTRMLLLGTPSVPQTGVDAIVLPSRQAIAEVLAVPNRPVRHNEPSLPPVELIEVVDHELIETRYQPIVRIADRAARTVEVLARLNHPTHGTLTPDWFVPRFEDAGLSFTLTDLVSTRAFADMTGPHFAGLGLAMAVNYPLNVLSHPEAAASLDEKRAAHGLRPDQVVVELTESRPVEDFAKLGRSLELLRGLGYRIAIDDVGPAVKNLERLLTLPFTGLKLDKSIVRAIGMPGRGGSYAPRVIEQAHGRGMNIVAEGVETLDMWNRLAALGVQDVQGYYASRPLPAQAVAAWLDGWNNAVP